LSSSPTKDNSVKLPRSIDWDLIAQDERNAAQITGVGPTKDHMRLALETPNLSVMDELTKQVDTKPSAAFLNTGRDSALSERSTQAPESGRYDPKFAATQKRTPAITIIDRSMWRTKEVIDEKKFLEANKPKAYQPSPNIGKTSGRDTPLVSRAVCNVGQAEQRACYGIKSAGQEDVVYDCNVYWEKGGGSRKVWHCAYTRHLLYFARHAICRLKPNSCFIHKQIHLVPEFSKTTAREKPMSPNKEILYSQPRKYSTSSHYAWTDKASGIRTVADLGDVAMLSRQVSRKEPGRNMEMRQDYRENADRVSSMGDFFDLAIQKPTTNFSKIVPRDKDASAIRQSKIDGGGADKFYDIDRAQGTLQHHVVPFSKLCPRRPASEMSTFSKHSPDVIYYPEKSWEQFCTKRSTSPIQFELTTGRKPPGEAPQSLFLSYPRADKPQKHQRNIRINKSLGHRPLFTPKNVDAEFDATKILSETGRAKTNLGYAWHPADCDARSFHVASPDLSAGGKGRPNVAQKLLDKVYDTSKAWKHVDKHVSVPNLGQGAAGLGMGSAERKVKLFCIIMRVQIACSVSPAQYIDVCCVCVCVCVCSECGCRCPCTYRRSVCVWKQRLRL
jgi:hypothetical protein